MLFQVRWNIMSMNRGRPTMPTGLLKSYKKIDVKFQYPETGTLATREFKDSNGNPNPQHQRLHHS
jgi:hypothetical protein